MTTHRRRLVRSDFGALLLVGAFLAPGCSTGGKPAEDAATAPAPQEAASTPAGQAPPAGESPAEAEAPLPEVASPYDALPPQVRSRFDQRFTGDLDEMVKRRMVRAGVTFNRTHYFIDKGEQRGLAYESLRSFEEQINKTLGTGNLKVHVVFVPLARSELLTALTDGRVDMVAAQLTITPERQQLADFTIPVRTGVSEIVVTGPDAPVLSSIEDLSGKSVFVRPSSSYHASLVELNGRLSAAGMAPVTIAPAPEVLEDDDILEMVNAGLVPITVVDDYLAEFWEQVFTAAKPHKDLTLRTGGNIAVAVRKDNPRMKAAGDDWIRKNGLGTAFGNVLNKRYLQNTGYAAAATSEAERRKFRELVSLFRKYSGQYDLDFLLMAAQGYQESRLDQGAKSQVGAIGVMQVMPKTGAERSRRGQIHSSADGQVPRRPGDRSAEQGIDGLRGLQRRARPAEAIAGHRQAARPEPEPLVRERRAHRVRAHWSRDRAVRQQHLQVLRRLQADPGAAGSAGGSQEAGREVKGLAERLPRTFRPPRGVV